MKQWYVIQVLAGYEERIKAEILRRIPERHLEDQFGDVLIPEAKVATFFAGEDENENLFPGYMLVELEPSASNFRLVSSTPRVLRFLGGENPAPLAKAEVNRVRAQVTGELVVARPETAFEVGKEIEIKSGPFSGFSGIINTVDSERERLTVMVSIFGRLTPVEISFEQVKNK